MQPLAPGPEERTAYEFDTLVGQAESLGLQIGFGPIPSNAALRDLVAKEAARQGVPVPPARPLLSGAAVRGINPNCLTCGGSGFYNVDQGDGYREEYNCACTEGACDCEACAARRHT